MSNYKRDVYLSNSKRNWSKRMQMNKKLRLQYKKELKKREPSPTDPRTEVIESIGYITHGIKAKDWKAKQRDKILREFIEKMGNNQEYGDLSQRALVNLASEMAKKQ